jgi:L-arabinose isomerase
MVANEGANFAGCVRGWMKPKKNIGAFLESLSKAGATHHSILVYGANIESMGFFGNLLGLKVVEI